MRNVVSEKITVTRYVCLCILIKLSFCECYGGIGAKHQVGNVLSGYNTIVYAHFFIFEHLIRNAKGTHSKIVHRGVCSKLSECKFEISISIFDEIRAGLLRFAYGFKNVRHCRSHVFRNRIRADALLQKLSILRHIYAMSFYNSSVISQYRGLLNGVFYLTVFCGSICLDLGSGCGSFGLRYGEDLLLCHLLLE